MSWFTDVSVADAVRWQVLLVTADRLHNAVTPEVIIRTTNFHINSEFPACPQITV